MIVWCNSLFTFFLIKLLFVVAHELVCIRENASPSRTRIPIYIHLQGRYHILSKVFVWCTDIRLRQIYIYIYRITDNRMVYWISRYHTQHIYWGNNAKLLVSYHRHALWYIQTIFRSATFYMFFYFCFYLHETSGCFIVFKNMLWAPLLILSLWC